MQAFILIPYNHIHFPVCITNFFLKHIQQVRKHWGLIPRNDFPLHRTSCCGFDWSREKLINPEVNIHFVTSQFRRFHKKQSSRSTWESLEETWRNQSELKFLLLFQRIASKFVSYYVACEPLMPHSWHTTKWRYCQASDFGKRSKNLQVAKWLDLARILNVFL